MKVWTVCTQCPLNRVVNQDTPSPLVRPAAFMACPLWHRLSAFLHAVAANLVSAAVERYRLGQTDGQRVMSSLEIVIEEQAPALVDIEREELGAATPIVDWASMQHETQYARLFRS